jgi:hypothetical protein
LCVCAHVCVRVLGMSANRSVEAHM